MQARALNLNTRIDTIQAVLAGDQSQQQVTRALTDAGGNLSMALDALKNVNTPVEVLHKLQFSYALADLSGDNQGVVQALVNDPQIKTLRDVALHYNVEQIAALTDVSAIPADIAGSSPEQKKQNFAIALNTKLFHTETSAVLQRMVQTAQIPIADLTLRSNVATVFANAPDYNIRTSSVYRLLENPAALANIPVEQHAAAIEQLKILQRVQAISPTPDAIPVLMQANLSSAFAVSEKPETVFLSAHGAALGGEAAARQVYNNAVNLRIRNEQAAMTMLETLRGSGLAIMDGQQLPAMRVENLQKLANTHAAALNLEQLFGGADFCECGECLSVYSPASYYVELLNYLRNNNLDPRNPNTGSASIAGTPLEKLFRRRPDLGCLELTCENTFTVLPYIDLVNEVMESFVVHLDAYAQDNNVPKQAVLEVFNVLDETSAELLAQPQHINYEAYCILKSAVYPFTLPYHQPLDASRIFLNYLTTSRYELLDTFRAAHEACATELAGLSPAERDDLQNQHQILLDRAVAAEFLSLSQEEYIILTKEAFWPKHYFEITLKQAAISDQDYRNNIGVRPVAEYYGYAGVNSGNDMLSLNESLTIGLTFVKKQFLPRTGIAYADLVNLLLTRFINPNYPQGKALTILESLRFSYRFLQTLVVSGSPDPAARFGKLIDFLQKTQGLVPKLDAVLHPDPCHQHQYDECAETRDLKLWVYCYFERLGKLIVLDAGQGPELVVNWRESPTSVEGDIYIPQRDKVGVLHKDGQIFDVDGVTAIGQVGFDLSVIWFDGKIISAKFGADVTALVVIKDINHFNYPIAYLDAQGLHGPFRRDTPVFWRGGQDSCDLDKVRLVHLDGSALEETEYDRIQRFIRLWRKLGWSIAETDLALCAPISNAGSFIAAPTQPGMSAETCLFTGFDEFKDDCLLPDSAAPGACSGENGPVGDWPCPELKPALPDITPPGLQQLTAICKLLPQTGLPLPKLLTFWADISIAGDKSLYAALFLTHNLQAIDQVFKADKNGDYLTQIARISDHIPVLMAALRLKADDIAEIMSLRKLADDLNLANVSTLYRHGLLAKLLNVKPANLADIIDICGDPFLSPQAALDFLALWGSMEDAEFSFRQLNYLLKNRDDASRPLAPPQQTILQISKTLYDGLQAIDQAHPDVSVEHIELVNDDFLRSKLGLLFEASVVEQIIGLLDGATLYTTNAPTGQTVVVPDSLTGKLKYNNLANAVPPNATLQLTGILTVAEATLAKTLCAAPDWSKALDRLAKQAKNIFNQALIGIFPQAEQAVALTQLLAGDANPTSDPQDPNNTAPQKRFYLLKFFLPFLRNALAQRLIVNTMAAAAGLPVEITDELLSDILLAGSPAQAALTVLKSIKDKPAGSPAGWQGYLIPPTAATYTFSAVGDFQPAPLLLDGQTITFSVQQDDPSNVWFTDPNTPVKFKAGKLYWLAVSDRPVEQLQWKTASSARTAISAGALLPDFTRAGTQEVFTKLYKAALLINGFSLDVDEVSYFQQQGADFDGFDFNAVSLQHWRRLHAYTRLRNSLPKTEFGLLALFHWAAKPDQADLLSAKIAAATLWRQSDIDKLLGAEHFDLNDPARFRNEINLLKLQQAVQVAVKISVDVDRLFDWAKPGAKFWACHLIAEDIRNAIRARFSQDDWEQVVQPLNNQLRENQKQALISYLLVQPVLLDWGVVDADSLFEFFLIDVQMGSCMQTSRIKQAISSVQLYVQRCRLGLEAADGVPVSVTVNGKEQPVLDPDRWSWMQNYRVWEANRKVFLYPENWIDPQLRDDKSPIYKELEAELLQKDSSTQSVQDALKNYLFKLDELAHLQVIGLFLDESNNKLHVFGRSHNAPYFFFYRYYDTQEFNWYPWEKMQVDIPSYDVAANAYAQVTGNGTYLTPLVWRNRLLVFFPQISVKTRPAAAGANTVVATGDGKGGFSAAASAPENYCEIKLAWSEYRNAKWTQKQVSKDTISFDVDSAEIPKLAFVPDFHSGSVRINVFCKGQYKAFDFIGSQIFVSSVIDNISTASLPDYFHFNTASTQIHSLQLLHGGFAPELLQTTPYFQANDGGQHQFDVYVDSGDKHNFYHPYAHDLLGEVSQNGLDGLYGYYQTPGIADLGEAFGDSVDNATGKTIYHELKRSYALYNWELGFHSIMQLADHLLKGQQFEQALKVMHYVFNPLAVGTDDSRYWQFPPFKENYGLNVLETLFNSLQPNQADAANGQINAWRNNPFQPHVVARARPTAYMKYVVMKYIDILIAYGDYYFRQFTLETLPLAIQCYVLASHLYGPRGQKIPKRGKVLPETYKSLLNKWDAFGNAMVELELVFPFSNQTPLPLGVGNGVVGFANVFGFATALYFCIPDNPQLQARRDTIDERLFKIRHCQDIDGVYRQLPLFEPPIDPGLLVQAAAQGLSVSSVLSDLNSPMPNYRFYYLLQKALEVCNELKSLGNAYLSAREKGDAEALAQLRAGHETSIYNLVMEVKKQQLDEAQKSLDALQQSRLGPVSRMQYYLNLVGEDLGKIPDAGADFGDLPNQIEKPGDDSGLKLIGYEKEELDKANAAADWQIGIGVVETLASIFHALPTINADGHPLGVGVDVSWGFPNLANATQAVARGLKIYADQLSHHSSNAGRKAGFLRQLQDRVQQANNAGYEIKHIDKQMLAQQIRISIANQEISNQQQQIDNAREIEDFLKNKYSNQELYGWMAGQFSGLYYQAYTLAYDLAKRAEKIFRFERCLSTSNFIQFGYWDAGRDGLLCGERLYMGLKQLEAAYQEKRGYDFELSMPFSLRQINPQALLALKDSGQCEFALPEVLYDMIRPGDYQRRIKSVSLTIPCVVGPYTSLSCTLRLLEHKFRISAIAANKNDYPEIPDDSEVRFSTFNVPINAIATSTGQNDSGVFELNFHDERYLPFEGAGAISKWRLEFPAALRQFDYDTISDVILQVRYTALDGGDKLKKAAGDFVLDFIKSVDQLSRNEGLFAVFDLQHDFPNDWYKAAQPEAAATQRLLVLDKLLDLLPIFTKGRDPAKILASDVYLYSNAALQSADLLISTPGGDLNFQDSLKLDTLHSFVSSGIQTSLSGWQLKLPLAKPMPGKLWMLVRYVLT